MCSGSWVLRPGEATLKLNRDAKNYAILKCRMMPHQYAQGPSSPEHWKFSTNENKNQNENDAEIAIHND